MNRGDHREPVFRDDRDREAFVETQAMEARRQGEPTQEFKAVRRGWCLGDKAFRRELLAQMGEHAGANHYGEEVRASAEAKAEGMVEEELRRRGWGEVELRERAKGDQGKVAMAVRLRRETTMTLKWVAERLAMGSWSNVSNLLAVARKKGQ